jgi:redox-regulated HSP33 family molecular chaperone
MLSSVFKKEKMLSSNICLSSSNVKSVKVTKHSCSCKFCNKEFKLNHNKLEHELIWHKL